MTAFLQRRMASMITRGKVAGARIGARTMLQLTGLDNEVFSNVELLLPPGYVAAPVAGSDVIILQATGTRSHKLAIGGDNTADRVANLQAGEIGLSRGGRRVILRQGWTEVVDPAEIRLVAPVVMWSPDGGETFLRLATELHTHDETGSVTMPPNTAAEMLT